MIYQDILLNHTIRKCHICVEHLHIAFFVFFALLFFLFVVFLCIYMCVCIVFATTSW